ncbi:hypothetical protein HANVADRAFT_29645 [Hanseniaspora valbyensis NRRL Y-1626]|uniref:K Homology domain-containing protein n=1 Tax=Hanseniaspora valbyensis NRRL Y-1626 TaxID=766949 RepID=A0A1B7TIR0_9ASCO|nr:hypothetical protein HANVADRAFT_29645 [Hanseniaspora valbyensis NRRL Y-1626]
MSVSENTKNLIVPGDLLTCAKENQTIDILGQGIYLSFENHLYNSNKIYPTNVGIENYTTKNNKNIANIDYNSKRYIPQQGDYVIATVTNNYATHFVCTLNNFSSTVNLPYANFPQATKKNRPKYENGDLVYCRVKVVDSDLPAELECMDSETGNKEGFGLLEAEKGKHTAILNCSLAYCRELLFNDKGFPLLSDMVKKNLSFEVAIGINGSIWISTGSLLETLCVYKILSKCEKAERNLHAQIIEDTIKEYIKE